MGRSARDALDWLLADRTDPDRRWVVGQFPNAVLVVFVVLTLLRLVVDEGGWGTAVYAGTRVALLWWAGDELLRGVNPLRRLLGAGVLGFALLGLLR